MWDDDAYTGTMLWFTLVVFALCVIAVWSISLASAHDSWISKGVYKNKNGEWCCGDYDCRSYQHVETNEKGWIIDNSEIKDAKVGDPKGKEFVPYDDPATIDKVVPPDGGLTICRRYDGSRRCVFGLKPGG